MSAERKMNGKECTNAHGSGHADYKEAGGTILNEDEIRTLAALVQDGAHIMSASESWAIQCGFGKQDKGVTKGK
jgi:hypothetical protein